MFEVELSFSSCEDSRVRSAVEKIPITVAVEDPGVTETRITRVPTAIYNCGTSLKEQCYENKLEQVAVRRSSNSSHAIGHDEITLEKRRMNLDVELRFPKMSIAPYRLRIDDSEERRLVRRISAAPNLPLPPSVETRLPATMDGAIRSAAEHQLGSLIRGQKEIRETAERAERAALQKAIEERRTAEDLEAGVVILPGRRDQLLADLAVEYGVPAAFLESLMSVDSFDRARRGF
jgi:hypothetical protein